MLRAEKQLAQEINALMRKAEILDAQEDRRYGKTNRGSDLPDELRRRQDRLVRIRQARKEMEAETAAAAARQRHEEVDKARAEADTAKGSDAPAVEQAKLNKRAEAAAVKAKAAREKAIEAVQEGGLELPELEPLAAEAMPRRGLARKADGTPTQKTQRNFTDPDSHLMKFDGHYIQGYNGQLAVDSDHQVGVSNQVPNVEHLAIGVRTTLSSAPSRGLMPTSPPVVCPMASNRQNAVQCPRTPMSKARKLRSKAGSAIYAQRKEIVEPVNGQINEARGLRRFLLWGLEKVDAEWH